MWLTKTQYLHIAAAKLDYGALSIYNKKVARSPQN